MKPIQKSVLILMMLAISGFLLAQTTGKITGRVFDKETGQPLSGANVLVEGTPLGSATADDGFFLIINVPPGIFSLRANMMGYETVRMENLRVSVNRTTDVKFEMKQTVLEGQVVVVQADKVAMKKDQTSSIRNVSSDDIDRLPVENAGAVINMQAGVVGGHFRGGRHGETSYMIDGIQVDNAFDHSTAVDIDKDAIQDMEVITGTFNAEYGRAMSGVVNLITKDGGNRFHGKVEQLFGNYLTPHKSIFIGLKDGDFLRNQDFKAELEGPIWKDHLTFYSNVRYEDNKSHLNGIRMFKPWDRTDYSQWPIYYSEATGDGNYHAMNWGRYIKALGKLSFKAKSFRTSFTYSRNDDRGQGYSHVWKYAPEARATWHDSTDFYSLNINHMFSRTAFYELKAMYYNQYNGNYLYENPLDSRYISDEFRTNSSYMGFYTGGQDKGHYYRKTERGDLKFDMTWQALKQHALKTGFQYTMHRFNSVSREIRNRWESTEFENEIYEPWVYPDTTAYADIYTKEPVELSAYLQDKMEFDEMTINLGVRLDYFDPKTVFPSNRRNPDNRLYYAEDPSKMSVRVNSDPKYQFSPRLGLAYQLGKAAILHFSYGHFFQVPSFSTMYQNNDFIIGPSNYAVIQGNSEVKPERTVSYEIGLWQELMPGMSIDVAVFYKDIYDLSTVNIYTTYNDVRYGLYGNKDYGNARGMEVKYDVYTGPFSANVSYTLQYTRGNADNSIFTFNRAGANQDPIDRLIPMSWDQRHTLHVNVGYNTRGYGASVTANYGAGFPYTWSPIAENMISRVNLYPNNSVMPSTFGMDFQGFYDIPISSRFNLRATLRIFNLLDQLNANWVDGTTGRPNQVIVRERQLQDFKSHFTDYYDQIKNPGAYWAPRLVKFGLSLGF
jgi:outer membrane receptor protein involved in Fe transport